MLVFFGWLIICLWSFFYLYGLSLGFLFDFGCWGLGLVCLFVICCFVLFGSIFVWGGGEGGGGSCYGFIFLFIFLFILFYFFLEGGDLNFVFCVLYACVLVCVWSGGGGGGGGL